MFSIMIYTYGMLLGASLTAQYAQYHNKDLWSFKLDGWINVLLFGSLESWFVYDLVTDFSIWYIVAFLAGAYVLSMDVKKLRKYYNTYE